MLIRFLSTLACASSFSTLPLRTRFRSQPVSLTQNRAEERDDYSGLNATLASENKLGGLTYQFMDFLDKEEGRWEELTTFVQAEREWGDRYVSKFIDREIEREKTYQRLVSDFLLNSLAREVAAKQAASGMLQTADARARTDERVVREVASDFLDAELSRVFSEISVCTDGLACGPNGGLDLFEAVCAFKFALGLDVLVVAGHCEGVCPREARTVAVRCPNKSLQTCVGSEPKASIGSVSKSLPTVGNMQASVELDALISQLGPLELEGSPRRKRQSQEMDPGAPPRMKRGRGDFSLRTDRDELSWSVVAARLILAELGVEVPIELVCAHRAHYFAQTWLAGGDAKSALPLFSYALDKAPPSLLMPYVETEEEGASRLALEDWGGSIWYETLHASLMSFPPARFYDTYLEEATYGLTGGEGTMSNFVARKGTGFLTGRWRESVPRATSALEGNQSETGEEKDEETCRSGTFQLKMSSGGHAFLGERFDSQGVSLGLWHGHRLLPEGPPAAPPPIGLLWVASSYVGRARARFALYLAEISGKDEVAAFFPREKSGALDAVQADCKDALSIWRLCPEPWALLAACREEMGDLVGAIEAYEELLFLQPPGPANMQKVAEVEALRSRTEEGTGAAAAAEDALKRDPQVAERVAHRSARLAALWGIAAARDAERSDEGIGGTSDSGWRQAWAQQVHRNRLRDISLL